MYRDDIKDLHLQKKEAKINVLMDFIVNYLKLRIFFPELEEERNNLTSLMQLYLDNDRNESIVLRAIDKQYGDMDEHSGVDNLLSDFDDIFENIYQYCQETFEDYDTFFSMYGDFFDMLVARIKGEDELTFSHRYRMRLRKMNFQLFDEEYKEKLLVLIPTLKDMGDELDG